MTADSHAGRPAVFLDRDGTVIDDVDYLGDPDGVRLIPGAADALRRLRTAGWVLAMVTNQSGIARGLFDERDYARVAARVEEALADHGAWVDVTLHCPHHPDFTGPCGCRKPAPGMLLAAAQALDVDLQRSVMVGDRLSDVAAGRASGARAILVRTGSGRDAEARGPVPADTPVDDSIVEAADRILSGVAPTRNGDLAGG